MPKPKKVRPNISHRNTNHGPALVSQGSYEERQKKFVESTFPVSGLTLNIRGEKGYAHTLTYPQNVLRVEASKQLETAALLYCEQQFTKFMPLIVKVELTEASVTVYTGAPIYEFTGDSLKREILGMLYALRTMGDTVKKYSR